jgi:hypothetical protein
MLLENQSVSAWGKLAGAAAQCAATAAHLLVYL